MKKEKVIQAILSDVELYSSHFNVSDLWEKITSIAKKVGANAVYAMLLLYYMSMDENVPTIEKAKIYGVLGYVILPIDLVPDILMFGLLDDSMALKWALGKLYDNVTDEMKQKALIQLGEWFDAPDVSSFDTWLIS